MKAVQKEDVIDLDARAAKARISARNDIEAQIIARAMTDEVFRAELTSDPRSVLEREFANLLGKPVTLPDDFSVSVVEETENSAIIVLPAKVPSLVRNVSPTDAELDPNGGVTYYCTTITCKPGFSC